MVERCIYIYILLLHRKQLHVSALDNGHLQVVHESLSKQLYKCIYIYIYIYIWDTYMVEWLGRVGCMRGSQLDTR